jgi:flagellar export protein FliJ
VARANPDRYKTLLRVRQRMEDKRSTDLAQTRRRIQAADQERSALERQQVRMLETAAGRTQAAFSADDVQRYYQYERHLSRWLAEKDAEIVSLQQVETERLAALEEAMKEKRMTERLHERAWENHRALLAQLEQKLTDETAVVRAWKKGRRKEA